VVPLGTAAVRSGCVAGAVIAIACADGSAARTKLASVSAPPSPIAEAQPSRPPPRPAEAPSAARLACDVRDADAMAIPPLSTGPEPSIENLRRWVHTLAGPELRGRQAGTSDSSRAARLVADYFQSIGASTPGERASHCLPFTLSGTREHNAVAHHLAEGGSACKWLIVGAHYDALGLDGEGRIRPGADDNATGVAVLLELARLLRVREEHTRANVALVAFGAEEADLAGSRAYVANPTLPLDRVALMINIDMAGRHPAGAIGFGFQAYGPAIRDTTRRVKRAGARTHVPLIPAELGDRSDSTSFAPHAPTVFFSTMVHPDYHRPTDTPERVDYGQVERALRLVRELVGTFDCDGTVPG